MDDLVTLGAVLLGAALALLGSLVHEWWQFRRRRRAAARVVLDDVIHNVDEARLHTDDIGGDEPARPAEEHDAMSVELDGWYRFRDVIAATGKVEEFDLIREAFSQLKRVAAVDRRCVVRYDLAQDEDPSIPAAAGQKDADRLEAEGHPPIYFVAPVREEELEHLLPDLEPVAHLLGKWSGYSREEVDEMFSRSKPTRDLDGDLFNDEPLDKATGAG